MREAARPAAVTHARRVVAAHVGRQRNVLVGPGADQVGRHAQRVELGRPERLDDLRARVAGTAARQQPAGLTAARRVGVVVPPQHALAARLEHLGRTARRREADVHRQLAGGDVRIHAVEYPAPALVLVEAEVQEAAQVVAGLRRALRDGVARRRAERMVRVVPPQEGDQVAGGGKADAVHRRVLGRVGELVERGRVEPVLQTDLGRIGLAGKRRLRAVGKRPRAGCDRHARPLLRQPARQRRLGGVEARGGGSAGDAAADDRLRGGAGRRVVEARHRPDR